MTTSETQNGNGPLAIYAIIEWGKYPNIKRRWAQIGAAFQNRDGSLNLKFDLFPTGVANIQVRERFQPTDKDAPETAGEMAAE